METIKIDFNSNTAKAVLGDITGRVLVPYNNVKSMTWTAKSILINITSIVELIVAVVKVTEWLWSSARQIDKTDRLEYAAKVIDDCVQFSGVIGLVVEQFDGYLAKALISAIVSMLNKYVPNWNK